MIQNKSGGLSEAFGGGGSEVYHTKKGAEKFIFIGTIVFSVIFLGTALVNLFF
jgi:protein translocase SecG subunit